MQYTRLFTLLLAAMCTLLSPLAIAHEGHDHNHWTSPLLHALFLLSLAAVGLACVLALYKAINRSSSRES